MTYLQQQLMKQTNNIKTVVEMLASRNNIRLDSSDDEEDENQDPKNDNDLQHEPSDLHPKTIYL